MKEQELVEVEKKAERMARSRRRRSSPWRDLAHAGTLGLLLVGPTVAGAAIGHGLARGGAGRHAALIGLFVGLVIGAVLVVLRVRQSLGSERDDEAPTEEEGGT